MADPITRARQAWGRGQAAEAERILEAGLEDGPGTERPMQLLALADLYAAQYKLLKVERAAAGLPDIPPFRNRKLLLAMENAARLGDRALLAERCRKLLPHRASLSPPEFSTWVDYLVRSGCLDEGDRLADELEAETGRPQNLVRSALAMERRDYSAVEALLNEGILSKQPALNYRKGLALDRLGRFDEAFDHFARGAAYRKSRLGSPGADTVAEFGALLESGSLARCCRSATVRENEPDVAFLFGFPRSGTTLLENVLDTQERIAVMPELPALFFVKQAIAGELGRGYPADLPVLGEQELNRLRDVYLGKARDMGFDARPGTLLVDKGPHHTVDLPLIRMLFPRARLILSLRHPLDVCLSCFQQDFELNDNTRDLISLSDIAGRYSRVFTLYGRYADLLGLEVTTVGYEDLVRDFEGQAQRVFAALGHAPDPGFREFHRHAAGKFVQSSARGQTDRPLYESSIGRWENYRDHLEPLRPQLLRYIEDWK